MNKCLALILILTATSAQAGKFSKYCPMFLSNSHEDKLLMRLFEPSKAEVQERMGQLKWDFINETLFILPHNDGEALRSSAILDVIGAPFVKFSTQSWGAKLRIEDIDPRLLVKVKRVVTFEMPGVEAEEQLRKMGYEVVIVDHHTYDGLNRAKEKCSLEQLTELIGWKMTKEDQLVAVNDRGFVPGLKKLGLTPDEIRVVRRFDYISQGRGYGIKEESLNAQKRVGELKQTDGYYKFKNEEVAIIREELAIQSTDGVVNVFEVHQNSGQGKFGFSGDPRIAEMFASFDYTKWGYKKGSYASYSVGNAPSKLYGFKPSLPPEGYTELLPQSILDQIESMIKKKLAEPK